jgi:hypothetical protein
MEGQIAHEAATQLYDPPSPFIGRQGRVVVGLEAVVQFNLKYPAGLFWVRGALLMRSSFDSPPAA